LFEQGSEAFVNSLPEFDLTRILDGLYRRKGIVIAVWVVASCLSGYLVTQLHDVYRSSTLIFFSPQRIPASFVRPTVTTDLRDRIGSINQQILSRTSLEKIVNEFNLYPAADRGTTLQDRVDRLRQKIKLDVRRDNLQISFETGNPELAMKVTNRLGSLFIEENLREREQRALGTTGFINAEADRLRKELEQQESEVNRYKAQYRFELPDQLDANLRTMEQLRGELQAHTSRLSSLQDRKASLEKQVVEAESMAPEVATAYGTTADPAGELKGTKWQQIQARKAQLQALLSRYSEKHPEVVLLREEIKSLEVAAVSEGPPASKSSSIDDSGPRSLGTVSAGLREALLKNVADTSKEIAALQTAIGELRARIGAYQSRVENTPLRGIELSKVTRTYDITLRKYQDLTSKGLESQISENMERKERGEQFQILDPAYFPQKPIYPNRPLILLIGFFGGLAGGLAIAFLCETLDNSFKSSEEVDGYTNIPLLATIPAIITRGNVLEQRRSQLWLVLSSAGVLAIGLVAVRIAGPQLF
jgi:polysaccharide chain length determinant protein (PEP-CTERM system associated)